jgi:hypothetical protein
VCIGGSGAGGSFGNDPNALCAAGHKGTLCATCIEGFFIDGGYCVPCPAPESVTMYFIADLLLWCSFALAGVVIRDRMTFSNCVMLVRALQMLGAIGKTFDRRSLKPWMQDTYRIVHMFTGDYNVLKSGCNSETAYYLKYAEALTYHVAIFLPLFFGCILARGVAVWRSKRRKDPLEKTQALREFYVDRAIRSWVIWATVMYLSITSTAFDALSCVKRNSGLYTMVSKPEITCFVGPHRYVTGAGVVLVVGITLLFPLGLLAFLRRHTELLHTDERFMERWNFVYEFYKEEHPIFWIIEFPILVIIAAGESFMRPHVNYQMTISTVVFGYKLLYILIKMPFIDVLTNLIQLLVAIASFVAINMGFLMRLNLVQGVPKLEGWLTALIIAGMVLAVFIACLVIAYALIFKPRKDIIWRYVDADSQWFDPECYVLDADGNPTVDEYGRYILTDTELERRAAIEVALKAQRSAAASMVPSSLRSMWRTVTGQGPEEDILALSDDSSDDDDSSYGGSSAWREAGDEDLDSDDRQRLAAAAGAAAGKKKNKKKNKKIKGKGKKGGKGKDADDDDDDSSTLSSTEDSLGLGSDASSSEVERAHRARAVAREARRSARRQARRAERKSKSVAERREAKLLLILGGKKMLDEKKAGVGISDLRAQDVAGGADGVTDADTVRSTASVRRGNSAGMRQGAGPGQVDVIAIEWEPLEVLGKTRGPAPGVMTSAWRGLTRGFDDPLAAPREWEHRSLAEMGCYYVDVTEEMRLPVQRMMVHTARRDLVGRGRDNLTLRADGYRVTRVERVENPLLWHAYATNRQMMARVAAARGTAPPELALETSRYHWVRKLDGYDRSVNESLLFHGTKYGVHEIVCETGLDTRTSARGMFGMGVYLAECSSKADEYVDEHEGECRMLLVRACLGVPYLASAAMTYLRRPPCVEGHVATPCGHKRFDSVLAVTNADVLGSKLEKYREMVVYQGVMAYPQYRVTYERIVRDDREGEGEGGGEGDGEGGAASQRARAKAERAKAAAAASLKPLTPQEEKARAEALKRRERERAERKKAKEKRRQKERRERRRAAARGKGKGEGKGKGNADDDEGPPEIPGKVRVRDEAETGDDDDSSNSD